MATITSVGVGSGLDLESLITNIIAAEETPTSTRLNIEEAETQATVSAYGSVKSTLAAFQESLSNLKDSSFYSSRKASSADTDAFTATAGTSAELGSYDISVLALATASKVATNGGFADPAATVGEGTLSLGFVGGDSFGIEVALTDSLTDIRDAINNTSDNIGITASLLTVDDPDTTDGSTITELVITANNSGQDKQINITVDDTDDGDDTDANGLSRFFYDGSDPDNSINGLNQMDDITVASNAAITVDGFTAYSSSNVFDSVINDVSITALAVDETTTASLTVDIDTAGVKKEITTFAASYNELIIVMNSLTDYDADTGTRGILGNDSSARIIEQQLRRIMTSTVEEAPGDFNNLSYLGFSTNQNGTISLKEDSDNSFSANLDDAVSSNFDDLATLLTGDNGIATKMDALLDSFLESGGTIDIKEEILSTELKEIEEERLDLGLRLEKIEERLRAQFAALDILVSQLNSTGNFLSQQLAATAKIVNGDRD